MSPSTMSSNPSNCLSSGMVLALLIHECIHHRAFWSLTLTRSWVNSLRKSSRSALAT